MYLPRLIEHEILAYAKQFKVVVITGPRQVGKTRTSRYLFNNYTYLTLEDYKTMLEAKENTRAFIEKYASQGHGIIIDEFQHLPELLSAIQVYVDERPEVGRIILTGSQNFLMMQSISQTLVGRAGVLTMLPLSLAELNQSNQNFTSADVIINGLYPEPRLHPEHAQRWIQNYIMLYLERDARVLINIKDSMRFQTFIKLCASRIGNLLNVSSLAVDCQISTQTAQAWLSILETCFIIKLIHPFHKNFNKRLIKAPKLYFVDTALAAQLLMIESPQDYLKNPLAGNLFENMVMMELIKSKVNAGKAENIYFWRDTNGHEIDVISESSNGIKAIEIKSTQTPTMNLTRGIKQWDKIVDGAEKVESYLIHGGDTDEVFEHCRFISWRHCGKIVS